ncbi:MAG: hypothetical protein HY360_16940 [Verrucomicrobia bacterium]|nr:hypothetical protein [Verrucomicrobiota bacterium]
MNLLRLIVLSLFFLRFEFCLLAEEPLFHAPFSESLDAEISQGSVKPASKKGVYEFPKGAFGPGLAVGAPESFLMYPAHQNLHGEEGTVSLWIQNDWEPGDDKFHMFWTLLANGRFNLYKYGGGDNKLIFLVEGRNNGSTVSAVISIASWEKGGTHHLAATWAPGVVNLFVDGVKVADRADPGLQLPEVRAYDIFFVGDYYHPNFGTQSGMSGKADTLIRDLRIYGKALSEPQIAELAGLPTDRQAGLKKKASEPSQSAARAVTSPPYVVVPRARVSPKVDGDFTLNEWRDAAAFTGFVDLVGGALADLQTTVLLTYDAERLYVAFYSLLPPKYELRARADTRDGQVWDDDSVEFLFDPTASRTVDCSYHFIGNAHGVFFDDKNRDVKWNGNWAFKSQLQENWRGIGLRCWALELSIPFADLERKTPVNGERWTANFGRTWFRERPLYSSWACPPIAQYNACQHFGTLEFREQSPALQWTDFRDLGGGQRVMEGSWQGAQAGRITARVTGQKEALAAIDMASSVKTAEQWTHPFDLAVQPKGILEVAATKQDSTNQLYSAQIPYAVDVSALRIFVSPVPSMDKLNIQIDPLRFRAAWKTGWRLDIEIKDHQQKTVAQQKITQYDPPFAQTSFALGRIPTGKYQLVATLRDESGKTVANDQALYEKRPRPAWVGNKIGITDKVLKPWTPVEVEVQGSGFTPIQRVAGRVQGTEGGRQKSPGQSVSAKATADKSTIFSVWGRKYVYDHSLFPSQVTSLSKDLLAGPIRFAVAAVYDRRKDGEPATGDGHRPPLQIKVLKHTPAAADFTTCSGDITVRNHLEFDGMLWCEAKLPAGEIKQLALEIPLRSEAATLFHASNAEWAVAGSEPGATPAHWKGSWKQSIWLGNEEAGFCWFAESDQFWNLADPKQALTIEKRGATTVLRINFVTEPRTYAGGPVFRFGLQATPMRPQPKGWRGWQFPTRADYNPEPNNPEKVTHAISWWMNWSPYIASPFNSLPEMKALVDRNHKFGIKVIPYEAMQVLNDKAPDVEDYKAEWVIRPQIDGGGEQDQRCLWLNLKGTFTDYFIYGIRDLTRKGGWDGTYFDFCEGAKPDLNEFHGSGYVDEKGQRRPTCDVLAHREFLKRLVAMFQEEFGMEEPIIMVHLSANKIPPIHSFCNVYLDGEQHAYVPKVEDDYTAILSLDTFRAEFLCQQFGGVPVMLPELGNLHVAWLQAKTPDLRAQLAPRFHAAMDTLVLYPMLHGTLFQPAWLDMDYLTPLVKGRQEFGMADARFIGYWENNPTIQLSPSSDKIKASVYAKDDKLWLVAGNLGERSVRASVKLDLKALSPKLDPRATSTQNIFGVGSLEASAGAIQLEVPRKSLRVIEIKGARDSNP